MRFLVLLMCSLLLLRANGGTYEDAGLPRKIVITFNADDRVTFNLNKGAVEAIVVRLGTSAFSVPVAECRKIHDVHFHTIRLLWEDSSKRAVDAEYFDVEFTMGAENDKSFGELPKVYLHFEGRKFLSAVIRRKTSETTWHDGDR